MSLNGNTDETNGYNSVIKNGALANAAHVKSVIPPIGSVLAWLKSYTNTPTLPDGWVECNGQTLSDSDSPYNSQVIPDLNGSSGTERFLRGQTTSGGTGGSETHSHTINVAATIGGGTGGNNLPTTTTNTASTLPSYYEVVWIMRIK